jgi:hypothetical protein
MKNFGEAVLALLFGTATAALAAEGSAAGGLSPLVIGFLAFFAVIVAFQAIPALLMLVTVLRGLVASLKDRHVHAAEIDHDDSAS